MSTVFVAGLGIVGQRVARQLVETPSVTRVVLGARKPAAHEGLAASLGGNTELIEYTPGDALPEGIDAVACALADELDAVVARSAIDRGLPIASAADAASAIAPLRALDAMARERGVTVAAGCGFAPGLADVLALHATSLFDSVDEVRIARSGWAGPASNAAVRRERRDVAHVWRAGSWREISKCVEQVWFPEPVSAKECQVVRGGGDLFVAARPDVAAFTTLLADAPRAPVIGRRGDDGIGAVRVEVWGRRNAERDVVVYGALDRVSIAAGTVLALTAAMLADRATYSPPGVHGLAALVEPVAFLAELATRGVRAAAFEGAPVA